MPERGERMKPGRRWCALGPIRTARAGLMVGAAAVLAGGCGGDGPRESPGEAVRGKGAEAQPGLPDSVRRIEHPEGVWRGPARLHLVRQVSGTTLSVGSTDEVRAPVFSGIRDVAPGPDGRILVLDGAEARVIVLDRDGDVAQRLGRRGAGPGELTTPDRVEAGPDGDVLVLERRPAAIHRWHEGEYVGSVELVGSDVSVESPGDGSGPRGLADWGPRLPGGRAVRLIRLDVSDPSSSASAVYAADSAGRIGSSVLEWSTPGTRSRLPEVFGARQSWTAGAGPDGEARFAVARGDRYEVRLYDLAGALRAIVRRDVTARPVTDALRERALDRFTEEASRAGAPPGMTRELRDRLPVAERLPVIGDLWHSAPDGRLWVGLVGPGRTPGPASVIREYDVYGPDGSYLGNLASPPGFELHRVRGAFLYGAWKDSLGVPGIRVYRLVEPGEQRGLSSGRGPP